MDLKKGVLGIFLAIGLVLVSPVALSAYTETFSYDANGFLASHTDKNGVTTTYVNNTRGLQVSRTEAAGTPAERTITTEWHPQYSLPLLVTEPKKVTEYTYDDRGQMLTRTLTDPATGETRTWAYTYNTLGLLATVDGPRTDVDDVTTYSYDTQGDLIESTNALGHSTRITAHDASGRPLTLVDANGVETTLTYDLRGRLLSRTTLGQTTSFTYDPVGNLTRITLPTGGYIEYTYDDARRLIAISDTDGNRIDYTVDLMGNRTAESVVDQSGVLARTRSMVYDQFSRLIQTIGAANQTTQYDYDGNNNTTQTTDALSRPTQQAFDALDRLINVTDPAQGQTQYAYDDQGNLVEVDDPRGVVTRYTYNGFGEVVELNSPDTGVTTYAYDPAGNLVRLTDARGVTVNYAYDALNRVTEVTYDDPLLNVTYAYDQGPNGIGRLTAITDSNGATSFEYDAQGNVIAVTRLQGVTGYTVEYAYDAANNVVGMTYPSGRVVNYERDMDGNVTRVTLTENGQTTVVAEGIDYEPFGPVTAMGYGNGLTLDHSYDLDGQLTAQVVSGARNVDLTYDPVGNITAIDDLLAGLESQQFTYDELDRLVDAMGDYGSVNWSYDATGNRLTENDNGTVRDYSIEGTSNRLLAIAGQVTKTYTYDANGNVTSDGVYDYRFDLTNRLVGASGTGMQASYSYNGLGQRAQKTVNGTTTHFIYGLNGELLGEYVEGADKRSEYIWLNGQPLAVVAPTQIKQISETVYGLKGEDRRGHAATARVDLENQTVTLKAHDGEILSATIEGRGWRQRLRKDGTLVLAFRSRQPDYRLRGRLHLADGTMTGKIVYHSKDRSVGRAAYEMTGTGAVSFVQGPEKLAWMHADHLGTPRAVTDETGQVVWRWASDPFGTSVANGDPDGDGARFTLNLRFPGQYYDPETGLHYNYFRDYDPETGRYIESDPIGLGGGLNTYSYVINNPLLWMDPRGLADPRWWTQQSRGGSTKPCPNGTVTSGSCSIEDGPQNDRFYDPTGRSAAFPDTANRGEYTDISVSFGHYGASFGSNGTGQSVSIFPNSGVTISICSRPGPKKPRSNCDDGSESSPEDYGPDSFSVGARGVGVSANKDGSVCINLGPSFGDFPFNASWDLD